MPDAVSKQPQVGSETKNQAMPVVFGDQLSGEVGDAYSIAQNIGHHIRPADVMKLQRTFGNQATAKLLKRDVNSLPQTQMAQVKEGSDPEAEAASDSDARLQRTTMIVKGGRVMAGTRRVFNSEGTHAATVAGGTRLEIDQSSTIKVGSDDAFEVVTQVKAPMFRPVSGSFGVGDSEDASYYIKSKNLKPIAPAPKPAEAAPESKPAELGVDLGGGAGMGYSNGTGTVTIPIAGQKLIFSANKDGVVSGTVTGKIEAAALEPELPSFDYNVDFPIPGTPAYVTAGLEVKPEISMGFAGGDYTLTIGTGSADHSFVFNAEAKGTLGLEVKAKAGVGIGAANLAGIDAGAFVAANASAGLGAKLKGTITASNADGWKSGTLTLEDIEAAMTIKGEAGAFVRVKALAGYFSATKEFKLAEKEIGLFKYKRDPISIVKAGMDKRKLNLTIGDFVAKSSQAGALIDPDSATPSTPLVMSDQNAFTGQDFGQMATPK